jgi:hypothetical protein
MQSILKTIVFFILSAFILGLFSGCASTTKKIPIREIDRPINMPAGIKQVSTDFFYEYFKYFDKTWAIIWPILHPDIAYAVTDKITFTSLPFPVIQYQFYGSNFTAGDTVKTPDLALALIGGLTSNAIVQGNYYMVRPQLGIIGKKILNKNLWLSFKIEGQTTNSDVLLGGVDSKLGYQLGTRNSINVGLDFGAFKTISKKIDDYVWSENQGHSGLWLNVPIGWELNATSWCSIAVNIGEGLGYINNKIQVSNQPFTSGALRFIW